MFGVVANSQKKTHDASDSQSLTIYQPTCIFKDNIYFFAENPSTE